MSNTNLTSSGKSERFCLLLEVNASQVYNLSPRFWNDDAHFQTCQIPLSFPTETVPQTPCRLASKESSLIYCNSGSFINARNICQQAFKFNCGHTCCFLSGEVFCMTERQMEWNTFRQKVKCHSCQCSAGNAGNGWLSLWLSIPDAQ